MKIKMNTLAAGPNGVLSAGKVYDLDAKTAKSYIDGGYATEVKETANKAADPLVEPRTVEEFTELSAEDQRYWLDELGIEGDDSNKPKRIALFEAFLNPSNSGQTGGDGVDDTENGTQTDNGTTDGTGDSGGSQNTTSD